MYRSVFGAALVASVATVLGGAVAQAQVINEGAQHRSGPSAVSIPAHSPEPQPLDSKELLAIQAVGGAVVRSRTMATENADISAAAQQLEALRAAVESSVAGAVGAQLAKLHEVRLRLQARPEGAADATMMARRQVIAKKITELEAATQAALNAPAAERAQLLASLRERLSSKSLGEDLASWHTLTTLVRHR